MTKHKIETEVVQAHTLVVNARKNAQVKQIMENYGYTDPRIQEGENLLNQVEQWQAKQENCYSKEKALKQQLEKDVKTLKALYQEHLTIARFVFRKDPFMQSELQLKGARNTSWAGWIKQVMRFYHRIEAGGLPLMKKQGITAEELAQGKAMAEAVMVTYHEKKSCAGNAQSATQNRNDALKAMGRWVSNYIKIARVAFQHDPQLLEALGITVPSKV